ncbi:hypothetical protein Y032_0071g585 [Ancylostoma ceylanicum]|uniref:Uncharacterized protein n=1 Tax=Ancylostoma ceylanicum TaxID=53326 RepID=A0A016TWW8_9BILA|nr:hypothetical protein Y032_0071g585 [Ancylostoma ceylanicum]
MMGDYHRKKEVWGDCEAYRNSNEERIEAGHECEAYFADGVFVGAQKVAVPSIASFPKFVGNRSDAEPLSDFLVADDVCNV